MNKIKKIEVQARVRYWEDSDINGERDTESGGFMPLKNGDSWCPTINTETGIIDNWPKGTTANVHYKVVDCFSCKALDEKGDVIVELDNEYVPEFMYPKENGFGDYVIMDIDGDGKIADWEFSDAMLIDPNE